MFTKRFEHAILKSKPNAGHKQWGCSIMLSVPCQESLPLEYQLVLGTEPETETGKAKDLTNYSFSFRDWNTQFQTWTGKGKCIFPMHQTYTMWLPREGREALDNKSHWGPVLTVIVETGCVKLHKPFEQAAPFEYSYFLWVEN